MLGRAEPRNAPVEPGKLSLRKCQNLRKPGEAEVEAEAEPHMIPESAIVTELKDLRPDRFYLLVYIRPKSKF